jgi:6-phospho-3-hexuloisomerase
METDMDSSYQGALTELSEVFVRLDDSAVDAAVTEIHNARRVVLYGCGRERLQVMGFCMRLYHLGLQAAMTGDMTTPPVGQGDLFIASAGPGYLSTASALLGVAGAAGARRLVVTAEATGATSRMADRLLVIPAQTMARDQQAKASTLPMGSLFEGSLFILFEVMILKLMKRRGTTYADLRKRHTNLE